MKSFSSSVRGVLITLIFLVGLFSTQVSVIAQESNWIWSPRSSIDPSQHGECYFRKKFTLVHPETCQLFIAAGDRYELYINGRAVGTGSPFGESTELDVSAFLQPGVNLIAVKVEHLDGEQIGLAMKFRVKERGETRWRSLVTDASWKSRIAKIESWKSTSLNDIGWIPAIQIRTVGLDGSSLISSSRTLTQPGAATVAAKPVSDSHPVSDSATEPAKVEEELPNPPIAVETTPHHDVEKQPITTKKTTQVRKKPSERFDLSDEFTVEQVLLDSETGSLIAMTFNEFGKLLLSREGGPLLIADLTKPTNHPNRVRVLCDEVESCQGILPLNGDVYVTGQGPNGLALYRLSDVDKNGVLKPTKALIKFTGKPGEHGPHGLALGPDGMIYVNVGNGSQVDESISAISPTSPYRNSYEGDSVPRYEDPGGHARGVKAPGGTIIRVSLDGSRIETVAGGIRNSYDLVFDKFGQLFIHDSDMESDMGMSWYRPTKVFHVADGAEMGWRSGWSKFPDYFPDQTPTVSETGRGSPTGATLYQHLQFPARYHDSLFFADWSEGRILALRTEPKGAGYTAKVEEFMTGKPLNIVDLSVGEDGALYFCTGGRGTAGGVYRVVWNGQVPDKMLKFDTNLEKVIRHPQPNSAWARQNIARLKQLMGTNQWNQAIVGVADEKRNTVKYRLSAMDKMVLYGPFPTEKSLSSYAVDEQADIRTKAAQLCGLKRSPHHLGLLEKLIADKDARVRRVACESYMKLGEQPPIEPLLAMVASTDHAESSSARRMLERIPTEQWSDQVLSTDDIHQFINGALAMVTGSPSLENSYEILARCSQFMEGFVSDQDFLDLLRVVQLALIQGKVTPDKVPAFANRIGNEFPSGSGVINRELCRIMAYLKIGSLDERIVDYFSTDADAATETATPQDSDNDKLHVALYLQRIGDQLSGDERLALINYLESAYDRVGGGSYKSYLTQAIRDVADTLTADQVKSVLGNSEKWPTAVISAFYKMPQELDSELLELVIRVDQQASKNPADPRIKQIRLGVIAILAQSDIPEAMEYLRIRWQDEPDRRGDIAIGLAQQPDGPNWAYLVSSLPVLDDMTCNEVLGKLKLVNRRPRDARHFRAVIELGYRLRAGGALSVAQLLEHWTGETVAPGSNDWSQVMTGWKSWYENKYPADPGITLKQQSTEGQFSTDQVLSFIESNGLGDADHGRQIYTRAKCGLCHQMGAEGIPVGPDLTSVANRFSTREIIESIIHPSNVVPSQYRSRIILTNDGDTLTGMATENPDGSWQVIQLDGNRIRIGNDSIDEIKDTELSSMPTRLLDGLSIQEVADLMAFLNEKNVQQTKVESRSDVR